MKSISLLLVDDDEIERMKFKKVCEKINTQHKISDAENGEKALELLENPENIYNIIISDLNMPKMDGFEFLKKLKSDIRFKFIPVIIMSTSSNIDDLKKCYEIDIAGYLIKPLQYQEYAKNISFLLGYWAKNELLS